MEKTYICRQADTQNLKMVTNGIIDCQHPHCQYLIGQIQVLQRAKNQISRNRNLPFSCVQTFAQNKIVVQSCDGRSQVIQLKHQLVNLQKEYQFFVKQMILFQGQHEKALEQNNQLKKDNLALSKKLQEVTLRVGNKQNQNDYESFVMNSNLRIEGSQQHNQTSYAKQNNLQNRVNGLNLMKQFIQDRSTQANQVRANSVLKENIRSLNQQYDSTNQLRKLKGYLTARQQIQNPRHKQIAKLQKLLQGLSCSPQYDI